MGRAAVTGAEVANIAGEAHTMTATRKIETAFLKNLFFDISKTSSNYRNTF
jgi:hypothetical protein